MIYLTSAEPEHAYGIMKSEDTRVVANYPYHNVLQKLFKYRVETHPVSEEVKMSCGERSWMIEAYGKNILYAPEFCPDDLDQLKKADIFIGNGYSFKDNIEIEGTYQKRQYVSMLNQISLCKKYGVQEAIFTAFGEQCVRMGREKLYKALAPHTDGIDVVLAYHGYSMDIDELDETLSVRQPFGSPGGKRFMLKHLMRFMPKHETYVECFMGGGSLFFKKDPSPKEIICDRDPEIYFLYKYIQTCTDEDIENLSKFDWKSSKRMFEQLKSEERTFLEKADPAFDFGFGVSDEEQPKGSVDDSPPAEKVDPNKLTPGQNENKNKRFYRLMYLKRFSDAGFMKSYNVLTDGRSHTICKRIAPVRERLHNVIIMGDSYEKAVQGYDSPDTFHFIDPPYPNAEYPWKYQIDPHEMQKVLQGIKGKFLLTYEKQGRNIFTGFYQRFIKLRSQANPWRGVINKTELLVANYPFDSRSKVQEPKKEE
jgi:DNA adenine methylase